ncbi:type II toxin-antitoxin system RelE/ParE family toxin [bacterium]|nr:type II toxin-antitoxin system RelE/ParE family toxin [bacterium]
MAARFTAVLTHSFLRDLEHLPVLVQKKILEALKSLEQNPFGPQPNIKKLKGKGIGRWRLRVGLYRIRYDVIRQDVVLYRVRHRKDIYRD